MRLRKLILSKWLLLFLAILPVALFAYLGHFSRLMWDDYSRLGMPLELGFWQAMQYFRDSWNGDYTNYLVFGLFAPLGVRAPAIFPLLLIVIWITGLALLNFRVFAYLEIRRQRTMIAIALASLTVAVAIYGLDHRDSFYWFTAAVEYSLPPAFLLIFLTLLADTAGWLRSRLGLALTAIVVAAISFGVAGFSEMYLVFQLVFLGLLIVSLSLFRDVSKRRIYFLLACAGFMGTLASVPVQLSSPGLAYRDSLYVETDYRIDLIRNLPTLLEQTIDITFQYTTDLASFTGVGMLLAAGLFVTLTMYKATPAGSLHERAAGDVSPSLLFGLIVQLLFVPYLWSYYSEGVQDSGRLSILYAAVVGLNSASILTLLAMIWQRKRFNAALNTERGFLYICRFALLLMCLSFIMTQLRGIHYKAGSYLFVQFFVTFIILARQLAVRFGDTRSNRIGLLALLSSTIGVAALAILVGISLWGLGSSFYVPRILTSANFLLMISALLCGMYLGIMIQRGCLLTEANTAWIQWIRLVSLLIVLAVGAGIAVGRIHKIPDFAAIARQWDESHQEILRLRDEGDPSLYTRSFYVLYPPHNGLKLAMSPLRWHHRSFYNLDPSHPTMQREYQPPRTTDGF